MERLSTCRTLSLLVLLVGITAIAATAQITPSADAYTNTASPGTNYGAKTLLNVNSPSQTTYIQFDLSSIPAGYSGSSVAKATLKLYVNAVTGAGSFNVDYVNGSWLENTITANLAPALGTTVAPSVALDKTQVKDYVLIDITPAVQAWLNGSQANDGIALVANSPLNASFDSKESTTQSHPPELDIVFASGNGGGITGVLTGAGSGLTGGGTSGTLNLSLLTSCAKSQILAWNGSGWACSSTGTGTITGVTAGTDLTGGGTGGSVTLNLDTTKVPLLAAAVNTFAGNLNVDGALGVGTAVPSYKLEVDSGDALIRGTTNFQGNGQTANLYVGDNNHVLQAGFGYGLTLGTWQAPSAMVISDVTGHVGIGEGGYPTTAQLAVQGSGGPGAGSGHIGEIDPGNGLAGNGVFGQGGAVNAGGAGIYGVGGSGAMSDGLGGLFQGGSGSRNGGGDGLDAYSGSGPAGVFHGSVEVIGNLSKSSGSFKIDHPLDPANKYLYHSFVESPDMMNIYNGNVVTDSAGNAVVQLPEWFETLNRDFRYQLTVVGQFSQAIVASKVANHQFAIKTDKPEVEVSWQVTGIRQDPWANAHRIPVEELKSERERGFYLSPDLYGAPPERSVAWARHPETMKRIEASRDEGHRPKARAKRSSASPAATVEHTR